MRMVLKTLVVVVFALVDSGNISYAVDVEQAEHFLIEHNLNTDAKDSVSKETIKQETARNFVRTEDMFLALSPQSGNTPKKDVLYELNIMQVMQSVPGGVLMRPIPVALGDHLGDSCVFFLKTNYNFVDGASLRGYFAYYVGEYQYQTILGVGKNIYSFELLNKEEGDEINKKRAEVQDRENEKRRIREVAERQVIESISGCRLNENRQVGEAAEVSWNPFCSKLNEVVRSSGEAAEIIIEHLKFSGNSQEFLKQRQKEIVDPFSIRFSLQPIITKTGEGKWRVSSTINYVAYAWSGTKNVFIDTTKLIQNGIIQKGYVVDLSFLPNGEVAVNNVQFSDSK